MDPSWMVDPTYYWRPGNAYYDTSTVQAELRHDERPSETAVMILDAVAIGALIFLLGWVGYLIFTEE